MLTKLFVTAAAATVVSVPLAAVAGASPSSNANSNDNGVGKGGVPARTGAVLDSVATPSGADPLNPNGVGQPVTPGDFIHLAKTAHPNEPTPVAIGQKLTDINAVYPPAGSPVGTPPTGLVYGDTSPGLVVKVLTPGCGRGKTATGTLPGGTTVSGLCLGQ